MKSVNTPFAASREIGGKEVGAAEGEGVGVRDGPEGFTVRLWVTAGLLVAAEGATNCDLEQEL